MRYFFPDPDNSERLIKTPLHTVEQIRADALRDAIAAVAPITVDFGGMPQAEKVMSALRGLLGEQQ
jgi:S-ribosylhomocysteine lyase LuxS involved in autoinducer biosynthesis